MTIFVNYIILNKKSKHFLLAGKASSIQCGISGLEQKNAHAQRNQAFERILRERAVSGQKPSKN